MPLGGDNGVDPLLASRDEFPILATTTYLISNSLGAMPARAAASLAGYGRAWAERGVRAWEESWWEMVQSLGDLVCPLIGAGPSEVVFQPNVTLSHAVALSAFDYSGSRRRIVTDAMHFPSILYLLDQERARGAELTVVRSRDGISVRTEDILAAIGPDTLIVVISHVLFKSAYIHDVAAIAERTREAGATLIVDGYQAVGVLPVDVGELGVDVYIGGCLKWLCGGPGAAFMWVRPELVPRLTPRLTGWMSHTAPFAFAPSLERRTDAWRFLNGTPNIPAFYAARPGLEIVGAFGAAAIRQKSMRQTRRLIELAQARGWTCTAPEQAERRGGTVALDIAEGYAVSLALKARHILCDYRPGAGIRLSPHFYTADEELDVAVDAIGEILESGAWRAFAGHRSAVT